MHSAKPPRACPKTGRCIDSLKRRRWWRWAFPFAGLAALVWFMVRVIPKPSRATYPCQRVAFPLASSFVVWLLGVFGSAMVFHRAKRALQRSRLAVAWVALLTGVVAGALTVGVLLHEPAEALLLYPRDYEWVPNEPIGEGKGIFPGRVVWVRDPNACDWDGWQSGGYWSGFDPGGNHIHRVDQNVVDTMMENAVKWLTGKDNAADAWDALFKHHNGGTGYTPGEKFAIKLNMVTTNGGTYAGYSGLTSSGDQTASIEYIANSRELVLALLKQLIEVVGVAQSDIYVGSPLDDLPNMEYEYLHDTYPDVHYMSKWPYPGREQWTAGSTEEIFWSYSDGAGGYGYQPGVTTTYHDYVPAEYANATYLINFGLLKSHNPGVTLCAKNHYGSLHRAPAQAGYYDIHTNLASSNQDPAQYRELVDLMGHEGIGGKTVLYLIDALWAQYKQRNTNPPEKYRSAPFNDDWPASLLASQDPVAIDSVGFDLLWNEGTTSWDYPPYCGYSLWPNSWSQPAHLTRTIGATDYLVEAALADDPPSGTVYDPERDGTPLGGLGTHEHWNDDRLYSRNLGTGYGIELITGAAPIVARKVFYNNSAFDATSDNDAVAPDKLALRPGGTASFANYTSYSCGINGIMIDFASLGGTPTAADFEFRLGNDLGDPAGWPLAAAPVSVTVHPGEGVGGSDRVKIIWADNDVQQGWLRVKVLPTAATGLSEPDVFFFGNAIGETGNCPVDARVSPADVVAVRNNPRAIGTNPAAITDPWDFNRDLKVGPTDEIICRTHGTSHGAGTCLELITAPMP